MTKKARKKKYYGEPSSRVKRDEFGTLFLLAYADRYVMCRRPGAVPFVMGVREWDALDDGKPRQSAGVTI